MFLHNRHYALVVILFSQWFCVQSVFAHSNAARPLKRLESPSSISLDILPRHSSPSLSPRSNALRHDDSFRLTLSAFETDFFLHLRPNDHLVHPAAKIQYMTFDDSTGKHVVESAKPLLRDDVRAYFGDVIRESHTDQRMFDDAAQIFRPEGVYYPEKMGWARITVHDIGDPTAEVSPTLEGAFSVHGVVYHVMPLHSYLLSKHELDVDIVSIDGNVVIWRESDLMSEEEEHYVRTGERLAASSSPLQSCAHDNLAWNYDSDMNPHLRQQEEAAAWLKHSFGQFANLSLFGRDDVPGDSADGNFRDTIGSSAGCPTEQRVVYMGVAADCMYVQEKGGKDNATAAILADWNSATALYRDTFNVSLGIVEVQIQDPTCPTTVDTSMEWNQNCDTVELDDRLSLFSRWRGEKGEDGVGLWHLMSGCPTGTEVGIAWLGTLCQTDTNDSNGQTVSGTAVSTNGRTEWQVVAHETGHNFGAIHDCTDQGCTSSPSCCPVSATSCDAQAQFIMSPVSSDSQGEFSPCTLGNICSLLGDRGTSGTCLINPSDTSATRPLISLQMCGNGIVEEDEDCDPGSGADSACCDPATCRFRENAVCDPKSSSCCTDQCSFAPSTQTCRASRDDRCDTAETCPGDSDACPSDNFTPNGETCGDGLQCASGQCTSVAEQCRAVGASMNLTQACPQQDDSCRISCQDPSRSNACVVLSATLVDGSPCGLGGTCGNGACQPGSLSDKVAAWYANNKQISIPVTIVGGLLILAILWCFIRSIFNCCCGGSRRKVVVTTTVPGAPPPSFAGHQRLGSNNMHGPYPASYPPPSGPPPVMRNARPSGNRLSRGQRPGSQQWVDPTSYNGPSGGQPGFGERMVR